MKVSLQNRIRLSINILSYRLKKSVMFSIIKHRVNTWGRYCKQKTLQGEGLTFKDVRKKSNTQFVLKFSRRNFF